MSGEPASVFPLGASVAGRRYLVYGLARSGLATVRALLAAGAEVVAWDEREEAREAASALSSPERGGGPAELVEGHARVGAHSHPNASPPVPLHHPADGPPPPVGEDLTFADPLTIDLSDFDGIVVSPGVPINTHPIAAAARAASVPLIGDIELFALARPSLPPHKVVGITGTNGKSTTTALVHHILKTAGIPTTMGGNIGLPILSQPALTPNEEGVGVYVLELSSYQIDLTFSLDCDVAVLLNITPDHLDRYSGFEDYVESKLRLFAMQTAPHIGVIHWDTDFGHSIRRRVEASSDCQIWSNWDNNVEDPFDLWGPWDKNDQYGYRDHWTTQKDWPNLRGPHNAQNAIAAINACYALDIDEAQVSKALITYPGLPHRMERISEVDGVLYVNDSKATNAASAAPALAAYPPAPNPRLHWIVGGLAKGEGIDECAPFLGHVAHAYLVGDATEMLARTLDGQLAFTRAGTLEAAVVAARAAAKPGDVVLLSPAAASFDQFRDFEHRGDSFRALVAALTPQQEPAR